MRKHDGKRHQLFRLAAGIAEHHALIACAETVGCLASRLVFEGRIDAERNIGRLPVDKFDDIALVEGKIARRIADLADDFAGNGGIVHACPARHFARDEERIVGGAAFHCRARFAVSFDEFIQNGVGDAVAYLIGMPFRHAFAGKKSSHAFVIPSDRFTHRL